MKQLTLRDSDSRSERKILLHLRRTRAEEVPDQLAYRFIHDRDWEIVTLTYGEIDRRARAIGARLESFGLEIDSYVRVEGWALHTEAGFWAQFFPGDHFFIHPCRQTAIIDVA